MLYAQKQITLKDGCPATIRNPRESDALAMIDYLKTCARETDFLLFTEEEFDITPEQEAAFLRQLNDSKTTLMLVCEVDGELAGNCQIAFQTRRKVQHRATVAIALVSRFWGLGIGTALLTQMIALARAQGVCQLELEVVEGNERAMGLYRKVGFEVFGERPDALRLADGTMRSTYLMRNVLI